MRCVKVTQLQTEAHTTIQHGSADTFLLMNAIAVINHGTAIAITPRHSAAISQTEMTDSAVVNRVEFGEDAQVLDVIPVVGRQYW